MDDGARIPLVALQTAVRADVDAREHNDIARKREAARRVLVRGERSGGAADQRSKE